MKKFDIFDYTNSEDSAKVFGGVFYDNHYKIASNRFVMVVLSCANSEFEKYKSKIIDKNGKVIDGTYPQYQKIIPSLENCYKVGITKLQLEITQTELSKLKEIGKDVYKYVYEFEVDGNKIGINYDTLNLILEFLSVFPNAELYYNKENPNGAMMFLDVDFLTDEKNMMIFMPYTYSECGDIFIYNNVNGIKFFGDKNLSIESILSKHNKLDILQKHKEELSLKEKEYLKKVNAFLEIVNHV